jgi:hypothetical protein
MRKSTRSAFLRYRLENPPRREKPLDNEQHLHALRDMERMWLDMGRLERRISYVLLAAFVVFSVLVGVGAVLHPCVVLVPWWAIGLVLFGGATWWREAHKSDWYAMQVRIEAMHAQVEYAALMRKRSKSGTTSAVEWEPYTKGACKDCHVEELLSSEKRCYACHKKNEYK